MPLNLKVEFGGGLELLFSNQRTHTLSIPETIPIDSKTQSATETVQFEESEAASLIRRMASLPERSPANVTFLLHWLKDNLLKEREELFMEGDTVWAARPGILVLINDVDWELEGEGDYVLKDGDEIVLISTLHGG